MPWQIMYVLYVCVSHQIEGAMEELREEDLDEPLGNNLSSKEDSLS